MKGVLIATVKVVIRACAARVESMSLRMRQLQQHGKEKRINSRTMAALVLAVGVLAYAPPKGLAAANECGWVFKRNSYGTGEWEWHWCKPNLPRISVKTPRWPDPRPPLTDKNSQWCKSSLIVITNQGTSASAWYLVQHTQVRKTAWPDYYHRVFSWVYTFKLRTGFWTGWQLPPQEYQESMTVDCDV